MTEFKGKYPQEIVHWIAGEACSSGPKHWLVKRNPANGEELGRVLIADSSCVELAVATASKAFSAWSGLSLIERGDLLRGISQLIQKNREELAQIVSLETGKSIKDALGEVGAAAEQGYFLAGEGRRFYGHTTTSAVPNRTARTVRQPIGVCGLIVPANTPIANIAWKVFPALLCGNTAVLKAAEDTPYIALRFAELAKEAGLPDGVLNIVQGTGAETGAALASHAGVPLVSLTGSVAAGRAVQLAATERLAKVCLELGGKNALVVCDDADLERAVEATVLSAFSNAGQRCASGSRIIVFESIYATFRQMLLDRVATLKVGTADSDDYGPVINERQLNSMLNKVRASIELGQAKLLTGGHRLEGAAWGSGFYVAPTVLEEVERVSPIARDELFGPITCLFRVENYEQAVELVNASDFGLTAAIHTASIHRAEHFQSAARTGVVSVNGPTYGSEPHLPFGGLGLSGNGFREAGTEALDVYSDWKTIYVRHFPDLL